MPYNQEFFIVFYQLGNIFSEKRKWRIGDHDIGLFQQFDTFRAAEIASLEDGKHVFVVFQQVLNVTQVNSSISVHVAYLSDLNLIGNLFGLLGEIAPINHQFIALNRRAIIAGANQLFQPQLVETEGKVFEEIALVGVIAVTQDGLTAKVLPVVLQLPLNIAHLRVKLVFLCRLSGIQVFVCHDD